MKSKTTTWPGGHSNEESKPRLEMAVNDITILLRDPSAMSVVAFGAYVVSQALITGLLIIGLAFR